METVKTLFVLFLCLHAVNAFESAAEVSQLCSQLQSPEQMQQSIYDCPAMPFVKPLQKMIVCCDARLSNYDKWDCLKVLIDEEKQITRAFNEWKEPALLEDKFVKNLGHCAYALKPDCDDDPMCIDPARSYKLNCKLGNRNDEVNFYEPTKRGIREPALRAVCINNDTAGAIWIETVHRRCMRAAGARDVKYAGVDADQHMLENYCIDDRLGRYATNKTYDQELQTRKWAPDYLEMLLKEGVYDLGPIWARTFIHQVCENIPVNDEEALSKRCLATDPTMNYLTHVSVDKVEKVCRSCCTTATSAKIASKEENKDKNFDDTMKTCLDEAGLYHNFYALSGNTMRSLLRSRSGYEYECISKTNYDKGATPYYDQEMPLNDRSNAYKDFASPKRFTESLEVPSFTIEPLNYLFFLRNFSESVNDTYWTTACSACKTGLRLGKQAYVFPALICPNLVYQNFYKPIVHDETCPDDLLYKVQVAHYCCLYAAYDRYGIADYDEHKCHTDV